MFSWDNVYRNENDNYDKDGLEGEVWFGEHSTERIVKWCLQNKDVIPTSSSIIDLGCGNGQAAIELCCEGFENVIGVDYCDEAVKLASKIAEQRNVQNVEFKQCDILSNVSDIQSRLSTQNFDVCFDKGTYDAISLCPDDALSKREKYIENVFDLLRSNVERKSFLIITSCNWTKEELVKQFDNRFDVHTVIPTPQFKFGGVVGNNVTSVVFAKKIKQEEARIK